MAVAGTTAVHRWTRDRPRARRPLLLLIEGIYVTGQPSEEGPAQSAFTVAKLLVDVSVAKA